MVPESRSSDIWIPEDWRPLRYVMTADGLVLAGSEVGVAPADAVEDRSLREALDRARTRVEEAVRTGVGHLGLTDQEAGPTRVAMPTILATSAAHSWLVK